MKLGLALVAATAALALAAPCTSKEASPAERSRIEELQALRPIIKEVCLFPDAYGFSRGVGGQVTGHLSVNKLARKFADVGGSATVGAHAEDWKGLRQADLAVALADARHCSEQLTPIFLRHIERTERAQAGERAVHRERTTALSTSRTSSVEPASGSLDAGRHRSETADSISIVREWSALDKQDLMALEKNIKGLKPNTVEIACATPYCLTLSNDLESAFSAAGWKAASHHGGGLGVDGVTGIMIYSCDGTAEDIKDAIESATKLQATARNDKHCDHDFLVVGEKPF